MKILYFHQHFSTPDGPGGIRSYQIARQLVIQGTQVTMVCGSLLDGSSGINNLPFKDGKRTGWVDGIEVIQFNLPYSNKMGFFKRSINFVKYSFKSIQLALTSKYDILFATSTPLTAGIPGIFSKFFRNKPFVFEVRDLWPELPKAMGVIKNPIILSMLSFLEWITYHAADKIIGLSPGIFDGIEKKGIPKNKIAMIPNGCDIQLFDSIKINLTQNKSEEVVFIYAGTHGIANGLNAVIEAIKVLNQRDVTGYKFILIGDGMKKSELIQEVKKYNLKNIEFRDPIPKYDVAELITKCDVGLQILSNVPSFYYGTSPNKFFDYLSAGIPVLTNYPGWVADLIADNKCGFFVEPDNPEKFADLVESIIQKKDQLKELGNNAKKLAIAKFDRNILTQKWIDFVLK